MKLFVPPTQFVIHETDHWWVNHRCDTCFPGYLMIGAKAPEAAHLSELSAEALDELGNLLARCSSALRDCLGAVRVYDGRYGHTPGHTVHFHVIPVYDWTIEAYLQDKRFRVLQRFYGSTTDSEPQNFDGVDMTLFIWRTFAEPGIEPPKIVGPCVDDVIPLLRKYFQKTYVGTDEEKKDS